jgi:hypothetical protein
MKYRPIGGSIETMDQFMAIMAADARFQPLPGAATLDAPKLVKVNLESLRVRFHHWLTRAFFNWRKLMELSKMEDAAMDAEEEEAPFRDPIQQGCKALSVLMVQQLYSLLARQASKVLGFLHTASAQYDRSHTYLEEIPDGCAYLIEQFGITNKLNVGQNYCQVLHVWDGQNKDTFGVSPEVNQDVMLGCNTFLQRLRAAGVKMRRVNLDCSMRTPWDSMMIQNTIDGSMSLSTIFPVSEYELPRDVFLAYAFCRIHEKGGQAIESYPIKPTTQDDSHDNGQDTATTDWNGAPICSVGRDVHDYDVVTFYQVLFRNGWLHKRNQPQQQLQQPIMCDEHTVHLIPRLPLDFDDE